ncbi:MAG: hypothetical protein E5X23_08400 [Mesorhizobium sp.]|uniref:hypothetical protein n=1 Tax=unclassified Mesorhizobium TaxID=325217 RepID=UPI000FEA78C5|nr:MULTISPECIES: hypothetical protein [unclassified Mesorhizobium]MCT2581138.1 hypothetical protein [Mesorhizobium sp. P13.3]MDF3170102.1 hypothetical protein [Mesorhizobium sp. P16.1]MDF3181266.1 hypothetical protein [Mesorhizobium sp. P17.1]MDF3187050.1 hypothetical protein [Mesorhizobium sp. ICCV3110.1]RWG23646.1 MAG: hypothetical protein EOQ53_03490 [Mesorhizobium sp.]
MAEEVELQHAAEKLIARHGGDMLKALKAAMLHNGYLEGQIEQIAEAVPGLININYDGPMLRTRRPDACREIIRPG